MKNLQQEKYEDDNGHEFPADKVDCLAPYGHVCDGFYHWTCGSCGEEHSDRWWNISGRVIKCGNGGCGKMNLLVRTNCKEITEALSDKWRQKEIQEENERLKDIQKFNKQEFEKVRSETMNIVVIALTNAMFKAIKG
jgi:hypothetical protein